MGNVGTSACLFLLFRRREAKAQRAPAAARAPRPCETWSAAPKFLRHDVQAPSPRVRYPTPCGAHYILQCVSAVHALTVCLEAPHAPALLTSCASPLSHHPLSCLPYTCTRARDPIVRHRRLRFRLYAFASAPPRPPGDKTATRDSSDNRPWLPLQCRQERAAQRHVSFLTARPSLYSSSLTPPSMAVR